MKISEILNEVSRRDFLKGAGAAAVGTAFPNLAKSQPRTVKEFVENWLKTDGTEENLLKSTDETLERWLKIFDEALIPTYEDKELINELFRTKKITLQEADFLWGTGLVIKLAISRIKLVQAKKAQEKLNKFFADERRRLGIPPPPNSSNK